MRYLDQNVFTQPQGQKSLNEEALVIHRRAGVKNTSLLILVHGLSGARYGRKPTWGDLPRFLFDDLGRLDIGLYEYRTLFKRLKLWRSLSLETEAHLFADILRDNLSQ